MLNLELKTPICGKFRSKIAILSNHHRLSEMCNTVCRNSVKNLHGLPKNCYFLPCIIFLTHDATTALLC